jgi:hypothetical protein
LASNLARASEGSKSGSRPMLHPAQSWDIQKHFYPAHMFLFFLRCRLPASQSLL